MNIGHFNVPDNSKLFDEKGALDPTAKSFVPIINGDPENPSHYHKMGKALLGKGKRLSALDAFRAALKAKKAYYPSISAIASIYASVGKTQSAIREYNRALNHKPDFIEALYNIAMCYEKTKSYAKAIKAWNRYLGLETDAKWQEEGKRHLERCKNKAKTAI